jgi:PTS system N-acetylglucosamine-specific IIC component
MQNIWQYLIIIIVLIIIGISIVKSKQKDFKLEANKLVEYLGGKENIISYETNKSRFIVTLKDTSIVNKEGIQKIGAQGIVEIDNQLKIILGDQAEKIEKFIDALK